MTTDRNPVVVEWHGARFYSGTRDLDESSDFKMARFESVGYLVLQDDHTTVIAAERNDEAQYRDITLIPTGTIVSIGKLVASALV